MPEDIYKTIFCIADKEKAEWRNHSLDLYLSLHAMMEIMAFSDKQLTEKEKEDIIEAKQALTRYREWTNDKSKVTLGDLI